MYGAFGVLGATGGMYRENGRDVVDESSCHFFTRNSSLKIHNCSDLSLSRCAFNGFSGPLDPGCFVGITMLLQCYCSVIAVLFTGFPNPEIVQVSLCFHYAFIILSNATNAILLCTSAMGLGYRVKCTLSWFDIIAVYLLLFGGV